MKAGHAPVTLLMSVYLPRSSICYRAGKMVFLKALWCIRTLVIRDGKRHIAVLRKGPLAGVPASPGIYLQAWLDPGARVLSVRSCPLHLLALLCSVLASSSGHQKPPRVRFLTCNGGWSSLGNGVVLTLEQNIT